MDRVEELLRELHQEQLETRAQVIRTDNAVKNLGGEIRTISRKQEQYERRIVINSVGSYALFALLAFAGLFLFFRASIARTGVDESLVEQERITFEERLSTLEAELERRRASEREAYDFYELLASGRRNEVVERFPTVQGRLIDRATIELFRREVDRIRHDLARENYDLGTQGYDNEQWQEARDAFTRSQAYVELTPYSADLHYRLGESLYQLNDDAGAIRYFDLALATGDLSRPQQLVGYFHRAESLRRVERYQEAIDAYRAFARRFDDHYWAPTARSRVTSIERRLDGQ